MLSRASALGWGDRGDVAVVLGQPRPRAASPTSSTRYAASARAAGMDALCAAQGDRLVVRPRRRRRPASRPPSRWSRPLRRRARSWSARSSPTWPTATRPRRGRARRPTGPRRGWPDAPRPVAQPTTCCPSGRSPATATPGATWSRRSTCPLRRAPAARLIETLTAYLEHGALARGDGPRAVRAPQHRALPAAAGRRASPAARPPDPRDALHPAARARRSAGSPAGDSARRLCRNPTKIAGRVSCGAGRAPGRPRPGRVDPCSSSSLPVRVPRPPASSRPGSRTRPSPTGSTGCPTVAGLDLAHYGTEADAETIRDTADRPAAAGRHRPGRRARAVPAPGRRVRADRRGRRPQRRRARPPPPAPGSITAEQAMVLVRERGKAMAEAAAATADRHDRRPRRRPRRGARRARAARPHRRQRQRPRPDRRRRHPRAARRRSPTTRRPRPG